jgi:argonaute-like protein implicated in RNA metabolism and viral defense
MPLIYEELTEYLKQNQLDRLKEAIRTNPAEVLAVMKSTDPVHELPLLHYACRHSNSEAIQCLLNLDTQRECINVVTQEKRLTPLHIVAKHQDEVSAQLLLTAGADLTALNYRNLTPIHYAARYNSMPF